MVKAFLWLAGIALIVWVGIVQDWWVDLYNWVVDSLTDASGI